MSPTLWVVLPEGYDDPARPSGGNRYAIELIAQLRSRGYAVTPVPIPGSWPSPSDADLDHCRRTLGRIPAGDTVLVDGLVGVGCPDDVELTARSHPLMVLLHMSFAHAGLVSADAERALLAAARHVVVPSRWLAATIADAVPATPVHVIPPGVTPAPVSTPSARGERWLCVATVVPAKGYDDLLAAVSRLPEVQCRCVGSLEVDADYARQLQARAPRGVEFVGVLDRAALADEWAATDLLVLASHSESYGMVVTEALSRGIPVIATAVGGVAEAMGHHPAGLPGRLVPPADPDALRGALEYWRDVPDFRTAARAAALGRRAELPTWEAVGEAWSQIVSG